MYIAPISDPNTISPAHAATQNVGRDAAFRSYRGFAARRCLMKKAPRPRAATTNRLTINVVSFGTAAKLIPRISAPTSTIESTPPRWSTGSVVSLTWLGTNTSAITNAIPASGNVSRKTDPHQKCSSRIPAHSGPPVAAQSAIDFVRAGPDQSAVISARVVG